MRVGASTAPVGLLAVSEMFMVATGATAVRVSVDGGRNWRLAIDGLPSANVRTLAIRGKTAYAGLFGGGVFTIASEAESWREANDSLSNRAIRSVIVNGNDLFVGTQDGVSRSTDTPQVWRSNEAGLGAVRALLRTERNLFAGTNIGVFRASELGQNWTAQLSGVNITALAGGETTLFAGSESVALGGSGRGVFRSSDQGLSWNEFTTGLTNGNINALATGSGRVFAATEGGGVFRASERDLAWTAVNTGLINRAIRALFLDDAGLIAGSNAGEVFTSATRGDLWAQMAVLSLDALPPEARSSDRASIHTFTRFGALLFAGTEGGGAFRSTDNGAAWTPVVTDDLPRILYVSSFAVSGAKLYLGANHGVFVSTDQGRSWTQVNAGLSTVQINSLAVSGDKLFAATAGGGVFVSQIPE